jgi:hypothetical protein
MEALVLNGSKLEHSSEGPSGNESPHFHPLFSKVK